MGQILLSVWKTSGLTLCRFHPAHAQAFSNFIGQNEDVGQSFLSSIMADGEESATHVVPNYGTPSNIKMMDGVTMPLMCEI